MDYELPYTGPLPGTHLVTKKVVVSVIWYLYIGLGIRFKFEMSLLKKGLRVDDIVEKQNCDTLACVRHHGFLDTLIC